MELQTLDTVTIVLFLITLVITITVSFFLKDLLQNYLNYKKIRDKLSDVVGKGGSVIFNNIMYKVEQIDTKGILLKNNYETVFIPSTIWLETPIYLPEPDYKRIKMEETKKEVTEYMDALFPGMIKQIKKIVIDELIEEGGEVDAIIGVKMRGALEEGGYEVKKIKKDKKLN